MPAAGGGLLALSERILAGEADLDVHPFAVGDGGGEEVGDGDTIKINYIAVNGRTGKEFDNSYKNESPMTLTLNEKTALPGFYKGLVGKQIGSRVLVSVPSEDGASLL